jgi:hypothetical protein
MGMPTLAEVMSLPDPMLNDNFDLHSIGGCPDAQVSLPEFFLDNSKAFLHLHRTCIRAHWRKAAGCERSTLTLTFHDIQGDQEYLDAHEAFNADMGQLILQQYNQKGEAIRQVIFSDLKFFDAVQKRDASEGRAAERDVTFKYASERISTFEFATVKEIALDK